MGDSAIAVIVCIIIFLLIGGAVFATFNDQGSFGAKNFIELGDVPSTYLGQAGKAVTVTAGADGLEFTAIAAFGTPNLQAVTDIGNHTTNSIDFAGGTVTATLYLDADIFTDRWSNLSENTVIGVNAAGDGNMTGDDNSLFGYVAGQALIGGQDNTFIGRGSGSDTTEGDLNVFLGRNAGNKNILGNYNTFLGAKAGESGTGNSGCVFIGYDVGSDETEDNLLYIDNSNTPNPLIWGDFSTNEVDINGELNAGSPTGGNYLEIKDDGELNLYGTAKVLKGKTYTFNYASVQAHGKPTLVTRGVFNGWSMPVYAADNEELFTCDCIPSDWDGNSDPIVYIAGWLDTANNTKKFNLQVSTEYYELGANQVVPITTNDYTTETTTANVAQYTSYKIGFTLDASAIGVSAGEPLGIRVRRIAASADEIAGEFVVQGMVIYYLSDRLGEAT